MSAEDGRRVVVQFAQRLADGNMSVYGDLVAKDFVNHAAGPQGRDGFRATFEHLRRDLGDFSLEEHHLLADGDMVRGRPRLPVRGGAGSNRAASRRILQVRCIRGSPAPARVA